MRVLAGREISVPLPLPTEGAGEPPELALPDPPARNGVPSRSRFHSSPIGAVVGRHGGAVAAVLLGLASWTSGIEPAYAQAPEQPAPAETASESAEARELKEKMTALVDSRFGGDLDAAFRHYDPRGDRALDRGELEELLADAGVGNVFTRGAWVSGIIEHFDELPGANENGELDWTELESVLGR